MGGGIEYRSQPAHLVVQIEHPVLHFLFHNVFSLRATSLMSQRFGWAIRGRSLPQLRKIAILERRGDKGESMAKGNHSFTESDIRRRFGAIVGHTVAEVDTAGVLAASKASRNKGRIGAVIEQSVLGYPADSDRRPDIVIDGRPWEVKATGLVEGARGGWRAKEPMSITAVAPEGIVAESFATSAFWHKVERLLVVYYLYVRPGRGVAVEYAGFEFKGYDLHTWREVDRCRLEADWTVVREFVRTALEDANLLAAAVAGNPEVDCDVLFQYCDLREVYKPLEYLNVALQYDTIPYRKWSSPLDLGEIGMDDLSLHEKCALQFGWELAGEDPERDRADMSVDELIGLGENEAEDRELVVWLQGYMDPYESEIDTAKYSRAEIVDKLLFN